MAQIAPKRGTSSTAKPELTHERLKELLHYEPDTGLFIRRTLTGGKHPGSIAGSSHNKGYVQIMIYKANYLAHRLAWLYMTGVWPDEEIDHEDGDKSNNKWGNLRPAGRVFNLQNLHKCHVDSATGLLGCWLIKASGKYRSSIRVNGRSRHLGVFLSAPEAHEAYLVAKRELHEGCTI
jgi:hypothetical protein